jgi:hypothetical protein
MSGRGWVQEGWRASFWGVAMSDNSRSIRGNVSVGQEGEWLERGSVGIEWGARFRCPTATWAYGHFIAGF